MPKVPILIYILCIFSAFFLGIFFGERQALKHTTKKLQHFVNIEVKKTSLSITKNSPDIQVLINGEEQKGDTFEIKK